jgi:diguanylate cyclase (GGDEF)-like protein
LQKRVEAELAHMARYDPLTGLANRAVFLAETNAALERARQSGGRFSLLMLDLDQFKAVNDSLGHAAGDALLLGVAQRLRRIMPDVDHAARFGGDEFALLHIVGEDRQDHRAETAALADRLLQAVTEPYDLGGRKVFVGMSIGITSAPGDGHNADALIRNADLALYQAKSEGRNRHCFFEASMERRARERRDLEDDMRKAIAREEFELHYQTIVDIESGECRGAEALVRWRHPERDLIPPDEFIALAERSGLIVPLGEWILRRACADAARWAPHLKVAVNLSPVQFKESSLLDMLRSVLRETGLAATRLELEITETVLIEKNEANLAVLQQLKSLGAAVVLDDFGIGYSSLRYLQIFPIDKIKIDKSFIQSMPGHHDSMAIVCAIAGLARSLDIETTAEGVETAEQLALLRGVGCQLAQGYLFSRPVPASRLSFERPDAVPAVASVA